ncbi:MAG: hypothetical protein ACYS3N_01840 [Planctomycetota bacterium]
MFVRLNNVNHIRRQFDISRPLITLNGVNYPIDVLIGSRGILKRCAGNRDTREDFMLGGEIAYKMMNQRIALTTL